MKKENYQVIKKISTVMDIKFILPFSVLYVVM